MKHLLTVGLASPRMTIRPGAYMPSLTVPGPSDCSLYDFMYIVAAVQRPRPWTFSVVCPNAALVALVTRAIHDDIITWHAYPFNSEPELADAELLNSGIDAVRRLDQRFGKLNKTVISQRDVPGVTRGIVPLMAGEVF